MGPLGMQEMIFIFVLALLIFGPKKLPQLGRQLGGGMREFKDSITGKDEKPEIRQSSADDAPPPAN